MQTRSTRAPLVILISGRGSNLRSLVQAGDAGELDCEIAGVISNRPDAAGLAWAAAQRDSHAGRGSSRICRSRGIRRGPRRCGAGDCCAGRHDPGARRGARRGSSLRGSCGSSASRSSPGTAAASSTSIRRCCRSIPGLHTHRQALADGAMLHGATVHLVTPKLDHGPIVAQAMVPVLAGDTEVDAGRSGPLDGAPALPAGHAVAGQRTGGGDGGRVLLDGTRLRRTAADPALHLTPAVRRRCAAATDGVAGPMNVEDAVAAAALGGACGRASVVGGRHRCPRTSACASSSAAIPSSASAIAQQIGDLVFDVLRNLRLYEELARLERDGAAGQAVPSEAAGGEPATSGPSSPGNAKQDARSPQPIDVARSAARHRSRRPASAGGAAGSPGGAGIPGRPMMPAVTP